MMRVGQKCWVYHPIVQKIEEGVIVSRNGLGFRVLCDSRRERPYDFLFHEVFPTREELCEHYRKIFE